jgi:NADH:flavin oxidoreductase/NADH oxidase family protein
VGAQEHEAGRLSRAASSYLIHQFLSDNANLRTDQHGGSIERKIRFAVEVYPQLRRQLQTTGTFLLMVLLFIGNKHRIAGISRHKDRSRATAGI